MARILIQYALPLLAPLAIYLGWMWIVRHRSKSRGDELPSVERKAIFWSIVAGFVLMFAGLITVALTSGVEPGSGEYQSPRLEDGKIVPPTFK